MPTVADVLRRYGSEYLQRFGDKMPAEHRKTLLAICRCRTGRLGTVHYACVACGRIHVMGRSCGNRHCPTCQQDKTKAWLEKQTARLLPCPYFLLTFTLPPELREVARGISAWSTQRCLLRRAKRFATWLPTRDISAAGVAASSAFCTPGDARWSIIRMCTTSFPAAP